VNDSPRPKRVLIVTGMAGAGRTTALKTFEDMGWETVDNLPLSLLNRLLDTPPAQESAAEQGRPTAIGIDVRTRGFDPTAIVRFLARTAEGAGPQIETLFLDCSTAALLRRYSATRHRD
jgi:RNase adapter protein RapZ